MFWTRFKNRSEQASNSTTCTTVQHKSMFYDTKCSEQGSKPERTSFKPEFSQRHVRQYNTDQAFFTIQNVLNQWTIHVWPLEIKYIVNKECNITRGCTSISNHCDQQNKGSFSAEGVASNTKTKENKRFCHTSHHQEKEWSVTHSDQSATSYYITLFVVNTNQLDFLIILNVLNKVQNQREQASNLYFLNDM